MPYTGAMGVTLRREDAIQCVLDLGYSQAMHVDGEHQERVWADTKCALRTLGVLDDEMLYS
jgi:hypothetical protein